MPVPVLAPPTFRMENGTVITIQQALNKRLIATIVKSNDNATSEERAMVWIRGNKVNANRLLEDGVINESAFNYITTPGLVDPNIVYEP